MQYSKEEFMKHYHISPERFANAKMSWEELLEIEADYLKRCEEIYEPLRKEFVKDFFINQEKKKLGLHSYHSRCKDAEHVIEKIIRKKDKNYIKYKDLNKDNYWKFLTDLIGIRGLILYKEDWINFHQYITGKFKCDDTKYVRNSIADYTSGNDVKFMAEAPKVHIRSGDFYGIYSNWIPLDCIRDQKHYRSVHYIINYKGVYIEIQVRTLFEESWGEIDHDIRYPTNMENPMLGEFSELLNRLSGMGDEMGSYYRRLQVVPEGKFKKKTDIKKPENKVPLHYTQHQITGTEGITTFRDVIKRVVLE